MRGGGHIRRLSSFPWVPAIGTGPSRQGRPRPPSRADRLVEANLIGAGDRRRLEMEAQIGSRPTPVPKWWSGA